MEQPTSQQQTSGETDCRHTPYNPTDTSRMAELRREHKKLYGYKPTGMTEAQIKHIVEATQRERQGTKDAKAAVAQKWEDNVPTEYTK